VNLGSLARPSGSPERSTLPIAGEDAAAKKTAAEFFDAIGYDVLDTGPLADSWRFQRDRPAYVAPYTEPAGTATAEYLSGRLAAAER
jgi:predicted dinucleotide-binding enzyme